MAPDCVSFSPSTSSTGTSPISLTPGAPFGRAGLAAEHVDGNGLPVEAGAFEIEGNLVAVARLLESVKPVACHARSLALEARQRELDLAALAELHELDGQRSS